MSTDTTTDPSKDFLFIVTGFGPFNGIPENPTSIISRELPGYLRQRAAESSDDSILSTLAKCTETMIIETSAQAVRREIAALQEKLKDFSSAIVLHLGVEGRAKRFHLESCAYNDATFRVPDEQGFQPTKTPILDTCSVGSTLTSSFDVPALVQMLNQTLSISTDDPLANPSTDPGRFVCNYIYCTSMDAFACAKTINGTNVNDPDPPRVQSLFLHVPPFASIPKEEQLVFVTELMRALYLQKKPQTFATAVASPM